MSAARPRSATPYREPSPAPCPWPPWRRCAGASRSAHACRPKLTRYERYQVCQRAAELLRARSNAISDLITAESGLSKKDTLYEVGRACDVFLFAGNAALQDDGQVFSCDLTAHGKRRRVYTMREPLQGVISRHHAIQPSTQPGGAQGRARDRDQQPHGAQAVRKDTADARSLLAELLIEAGLPPGMFQVVTGDPREIADELLTHRTWISSPSRAA